MKKNKIRLISKLLSTIILSLSLIVACCGCVAGNTNDKSDGIPNTPNYDRVTYTKADGPTTGYQVVDLNRTIDGSKTKVETITETKTVNNPLWFLGGPVIGLVGYFGLGKTETYVADTYTTKVYQLKRVEKMTLWADTPTYYRGGEVTLSASSQTITEESIQTSIEVSVKGSVGVQYIGSANLEVGMSAGVSQIYTQSKGKAQTTTYSLKGYEPDKYYRIAIKLDYIVYEIEVTNSKGNIISRDYAVEYINSSLHLRLESSNSQNFN